MHVQRTDKMLAAEDSSYVGDYEFVYGDTHCISNWLRHTDRGYRIDTVSHGCTWSWDVGTRFGIDELTLADHLRETYGYHVIEDEDDMWEGVADEGEGEEV